jgi:hypothetical protein
MRSPLPRPNSDEPKPKMLTAKTAKIAKFKKVFFAFFACFAVQKILVHVCLRLSAGKKQAFNF